MMDDAVGRSRYLNLGSYSCPWESLTDQQRTARLDQVLDRAEDFSYVTARDSYRALDAQRGSPDYCPADAVEERRKARDTTDDRFDVEWPNCELCGLEWMPDECPVPHCQEQEGIL